MRPNAKAIAQLFSDKQLMTVAILWHGTCVEFGTTKIILMNNQFESAYTMLVRSEEKGRGILEILVYAALAFGVVLSICQFAGV